LISKYLPTSGTAGLIVSVVKPQPGERIMDACAAPGGKTLFMASCLKGQGMIYAMDVNEGRLRILGETAKSHQVDGLITTIHSDLRVFAETNEVQYDKVLLDAPCSGLGVLSKRADLRWNRKLEDMLELTKLQDELLDSASKYALCTYILMSHLINSETLICDLSDTFICDTLD
jgi:16S rRNA (cytosine967-C5)-methyltransferase